MKVIITIKQGNKDPNNFTKETEMTPQQYDYFKETARIINAKCGEECISAYVHEI